MQNATVYKGEKQVAEWTGKTARQLWAKAYRLMRMSGDKRAWEANVYGVSNATYTVIFCSI